MKAILVTVPVKGINCFCDHFCTFKKKNVMTKKKKGIRNGKKSKRGTDENERRRMINSHPKIRKIDQI